FGFTASPSPGTAIPASFQLCGTNSCSVTQNNITDFTTSYTVSETQASGWTFDNLVCSVSGGLSTTPPSPSGSTVSIAIKEGDNVVCTYTNHRLAATVNVIKHVVNSNGGTKAASDFTMTVTGANPSTA